MILTNIDISVVIATLGGESLKETIESLNNSTIVPKEILLCIPEGYTTNLKHFSFSNLEILTTTVKGQVAQRAFGFQKAKCPFVLQLDDDIILDSYCLENLLETVISKKNIAVGPKLFDHLTNKYHSFLIPDENNLKWFDKIFFYIANGKSGYQPGKISKSGINFGTPDNTSGFYNVDWLNGGCIMHRKENLLLTNFYPFSGKAYSEDLFHSKLLREDNVILVRSGKAKCYVDFTSSKSSGRYDAARTFMRILKVMRIFVKSINGNLGRLYIVYFFFIIRLFLVKYHERNKLLE
jgi:GT2 family glycosyltransferase